jgi:hypothetical protein
MRAPLAATFGLVDLPFCVFINPAFNPTWAPAVG